MINLDDYVPLPEAAKEMGLLYGTAAVYCKKGVFPGAMKLYGTRWYIHKRTIEAFKEGLIIVEGAFRKEDRESSDSGSE